MSATTSFLYYFCFLYYSFCIWNDIFEGCFDTFLFLSVIDYILVQKQCFSLASETADIFPGYRRYLGFSHTPVVFNDHGGMTTNR